MRANGHVILERPRVGWLKSGDVPLVWKDVKPMIKRALDNGSQWSIDEIRDRLLDGRMQLWSYGEFEHQAVLVTRMTDHCLLLALSGYDMARWIHHLSLVEGMARQVGCKEMRVHGRRGWSRVLKDYKPQGQDELGLHILVKPL